MTTKPRISVPARWGTTSDPARGVLVAARSRVTPPSGVRPELVLRAAPVAAPSATWRVRALAELAARLPGFDLEDEDDVDLDGVAAAYRRFGHRDGLVDLVSEQWAWLVDAHGVTLTGTVAREDYADYCEVFEAVAATVDPAACGSG
jgi:hypothetical protein